MRVSTRIELGRERVGSGWRLVMPCFSPLAPPYPGRGGTGVGEGEKDEGREWFLFPLSIIPSGSGLHEWVGGPGASDIGISRTMGPGGVRK